MTISRPVHCWLAAFRPNGFRRNDVEPSVLPVRQRVDDGEPVPSGHHRAAARRRQAAARLRQEGLEAGRRRLGDDQEEDESLFPVSWRPNVVFL